MAAYVISEVEALDAALFERYRSLAQTAIATFGGRYIVRGSVIETIEGEPSSRKMVIIEFPSMESAHKWYGSIEYAEARALSRKALMRRLIFVDGALPLS